ncbi:MAG: rod shape-determining protein MreC [Acidimicrobiia bacterium]
MLTREPGDRTLPTLITLLVVGILLMTFDVRTSGGGLVGVLRTGAQTVVSPVQKAASYVVNPVADMVQSLANVATLRQENLALAERLAEAEAELIAVQAEQAQLDLLQQIYDLEGVGGDLRRTVATVIGRPDPVTLFINKGASDGIAKGQPVLDTKGFVVGSVHTVTQGSATIVPIIAGQDGVAVVVGEQVGILMPQAAREDMRLEILDARAPVLEGERVVTSAASINFPAGLPVGEVILDAAPTVDTLTTMVRPYSSPDTLRLVVVLAWPPDPITAATGADAPEETTTTSPDETTTTSPDETTTSEGG